jgi:hypothetical protein
MRTPKRMYATVSATAKFRVVPSMHVYLNKADAKVDADWRNRDRKRSGREPDWRVVAFVREEED